MMSSKKYKLWQHKVNELFSILYYPNFQETWKHVRVNTCSYPNLFTERLVDN